MQEYYSNKNNCLNDLKLARETFSNINTTKKQYEKMEFALASMYLYCPEDLQTIVKSTLTESEMRKIYFPWFFGE